ncbi:GntR family transcriptional regulator [Nocardioides sp.]|uniref:GntR family transcriptional regulator n=1 Tax=Nocardioides sp. TaxID=35761 RepID=UPI003783DC97
MYASVKNAILSGQLAVGETVSQVKLAERLGVSRTPLREALRLLEREGLIEASPNKRSRMSNDQNLWMALGGVT